MRSPTCSSAPGREIFPPHDPPRRPLALTPTLVALLLFLALQLGIGMWISRRIASEADYLVGGRQLGYVLATFSIFATSHFMCRRTPTRSISMCMCARRSSSITPPPRR